MPRRRKGAAKGKLRQNASTVTMEQYQLAWRLIQGGATEQEIREACGFNAKQTHWILNVGDASRKMEALRTGLRKAQAVMRAEMLNKARSVAGVGLDAIENSLRNSKNAQLLVGALLAEVRDNIEDGEEVKEQTIKLLGQLRHYTDTSKAAVAFRTLFGDNPVPSSMPSESTPGLNGRKPAALEAAEDEDIGGEVLMQHMANWTPEQLDHFIETGEEPKLEEDDDGIIEAEVVQ